ncbi:MAG TPA: alpha/beta hydrolase [Phototrophicaceae bacterium]|nr:alpha/beta hydrolase [Phototrophicaceae bacterium]
MHTLTSKDGTTIVYDQTGTGPAVILVDGAMCSRLFGPMPSLVTQLSPSFTVFSYDRRGRGDSGDTLPYAVEREIEDLEVLIKAAGGSVFLYGISSGAALSLKVTSRIPGVKKLAIYEPPFMLDESGLQAAATYTKQLTAALAAGQRGDAGTLFMARVGMPLEAINGMRNSPAWAGVEAIAPTLAYDNTIMGDSRIPVQNAASITVPTLVMDGGASPAFLHDAALAITKTIPGAQHRTLDGQTHDIQAEALAPVLTEFFLG